jgi:tripartite-type tricarboxylate transporter receptor subunit TctC
MMLSNPIRIVAAITAILVASAPAAAQNWPTRPITLVVPLGAGSSPDILARILAPRMSEVLGQRIVIENIGGAGGTTGSARVARAEPDGYQLVLGNSGTHAITNTLYRRPHYNSAVDFTPVILVAEFPIILLARKDLPANNLKEFAAYAKANQAKMQFGSVGAGSTTHLACMLVNTTLGIDVTHVPYRGGGAVVQDLLAGRIDYNCPLSAISIPQIRDHAAKAIANLQKRRSHLLPDVATAHEQGLTDFDATSWHALFLPKGTAAAIVQKLNAAASAALDTPVVQKRLTEIDAGAIAPDRRTPGYLQSFVVSETAKWGAVIKSAGLSVD